MYLGIDIGGTKTLAACLDERGVIQEQIRFLTPQAYGEFLNELAKTVAKLSTNKFIAAGVAAPGRINHTRDVVIAFGNLPWKDVPLKADVERMVHCPVVMSNDAKLAGLSEAMLLKDKYSRVLYVTISTGIGVGFIVDQHIDPALEDSEAGSILIEHNGKLEPWEKLASGRAIVQRFGKQASQITDEATWRHIVRDIAQGLADLVATIQPEVIVLGGGVGSHFDRYGELLKEELQQYETPLVPMPPVQEAARPDEAVVYGCYDLAKETYGRR
jgi:predicted NBD/HSP70 family sugar kinase